MKAILASLMPCATPDARASLALIKAVGIAKSFGCSLE
jgi:hypothetical protein